MNDTVYDMSQLDQNNDDHSELLAFLNSPNFRSFGEGLEAIIQKKMPKEFTGTAKEYLEYCCQETGVAVASASTRRNWFSGSPRPKKGEKGREDMFVLAFALKLTVEETQELFHKVFLDRAYDKRNYRELIYYHCLKKGDSYAHAQQLISLVSLSDQPQDGTLYTSVISKETENLLDDMELIAYINAHSHNFNMNNVAAFHAYQRLWEQARLTVDLELGFPKRSSTKIPRVREKLDAKKASNLKDKDINSAAFDYETITGQSISIYRASGTKPLSFKNAHLPKEIKTNFPTSPALDKNPSSEQLRKMIILLFSYTFWYQIQAKGIEDYFDMYLDQLDALLDDIGYPPMYAGHPFDWLFMTCSYMERPLDEFRNILDQVLHETEYA
jgi:hypothetical protein